MAQLLRARDNRNRPIVKPGRDGLTLSYFNLLRLDAGETPDACARRELEEETGMRARTLEPLTTIYTTPGFTDERIHLFLAHGLEPGSQRREADEFMELRELPWSAVLELVRTGEVQDGKTLTSLLFVQCFRRHP